MTNFNDKHISDPVYKTIGLSELETEIIDTPVFQRLRRVKHLGLVSLVYPGADFSRFDHSLGVCHITGQILSAIKNANPELLDDDKEIQKYRLAGLLHDIGHYPFSHPMEEAIKEFSAESSLEPKGTDEEPPNNGEQAETDFMKHEKVGEEILRLDPDLETILRNSGYKPNEISGMFTDSTGLPFGNLVKSDLDADRIDYLLRTAHHTGVPYGSIDVDYLISQMILDKEKRISLHQRALRSAEHLLLCRYFVYQQNIFHKTVVGFEYLLRDILKALLQERLISFSRADIKQAITKKEWFNLDDLYIESKIRELRESKEDDDSLSRKIDSIRIRNPVSLVYEWEVFANRESAERFVDRKKLVEASVKKAIENHEIDESLWHVWDKKVAITNLASHMKTTEDQDAYGISQSVRLLYDLDNIESRLIMDDKSSLMSVMADQVLYAIRVYVLLPQDKMNLKSAIKDFFKQDLDNQ